MRYIERESCLLKTETGYNKLPTRMNLFVVGVVSIVDERGGGESWSRNLMFRVRDSRFHLQSCSYTCVPSTGGQACHQIVAATPVSAPCSWYPGPDCNFTHGVVESDHTRPAFAKPKPKDKIASEGTRSHIHTPMKSVCTIQCIFALNCAARRTDSRRERSTKPELIIRHFSVPAGTKPAAIASAR